MAALQQVDEPARERIAQAVIAEVSTYEDEGEVRVPGVARCIVGTKWGAHRQACEPVAASLTTSTSRWSVGAPAGPSGVE